MEGGIAHGPTDAVHPDYLRDALSITELCALYGVSRKTGYRWIDRYVRHGPAGLEEVDDGIWSIHFCHVLPGRVDERDYIIRA